LIQGIKVKEWKKQKAIWVEQQPNDALTWQTFINDFGERFLDSQQEQNAKVKIEHVKLQNNDMDQYISTFEELAGEADYILDSKPVMGMFLKGLPYSINNRIFSYTPEHRNWTELKERALQASNAEANLKAFYRAPFGMNRAPAQGNWRNQNNARPQRQDRSYGDRPQTYNSTNAPRTYNNIPVPMDLSRTRGSRRGQRAGGNAAQIQEYPPQGNVAQTQFPAKFTGECYHCQKKGHMARDCRSRARERAAQTEVWESPREGQLVDWQPGDNKSNPVDGLIKGFAALSPEERDDLAARFQQGEQDFPTA
jgi:hypothetical protein